MRKNLLLAGKKNDQFIFHKTYNSVIHVPLPAAFLWFVFADNQTSSSSSESLSPINIDIDGNGQLDALTDGLLILRSMFGLTGSALVAGAVASDAIYTDVADIESRIDDLE